MTEILKIMMYTLVFALIGLGVLCFVALLVVTVKEKYVNDMNEQRKTVMRMDKAMLEDMAKAMEEMSELMDSFGSIEADIYRDLNNFENLLKKLEKRLN